jgi:hypothetical protein
MLGLPPAVLRVRLVLADSPDRLRASFVLGSPRPACARNFTNVRSDGIDFDPGG